MTSLEAGLRQSRRHINSTTGDLALKLTTGLLITTAAAMILVSVSVWAVLPLDGFDLFAILQ